MNKPINEMADLELFHFSTCPFCIRVRLALWRMGVSIPMSNIHRSAAKREELIAGGGRKTVPCLRIESSNGGIEWLYESADIIRYVRGRLEST